MDKTAAVTTETLTTFSLHASPPLPALPFDLVVEILCRLPVKLLLQLRCLCKSLNTLISDPKFVKKHLLMSTKCHRLLLISGADSHSLSYPLHSSSGTVTDNPIRHDHPVTFKDHFCHIFGSCNGMFCIEVNRSVFLWNPSIQKFKTLPSLGLGGYPAYGFGFDTLIDNYKVVCVLCFMDNEGFIQMAKIKVHTLGTNSWRMIPGEFPVPISRSLKLACGALHWISNYDCSIVSFDLVNESYGILLPPNYGGEALFRVVLDVLRDCLCIFAHSQTFYSVWMMKEYGNEESWTQLFRVPRSEESFYNLCIRLPIWISEDDQVLMKKECGPFSQLEMNLAICDFKSGAFKIQMIPNINYLITPGVYIESLVSPCFECEDVNVELNEAT